MNQWKHLWLPHQEEQTIVKNDKKTFEDTCKKQNHINEKTELLNKKW